MTQPFEPGTLLDPDVQMQLIRDAAADLRDSPHFRCTCRGCTTPNRYVRSRRHDTSTARGEA